MTLKSFMIGMIASFGLAWVFIIAVPVAKLSALEPVKMNEDEDAPYYQHNYAGRVENGASIYAANGCAQCHSQLIRPEYAGQQLWKKDAAGIYIKDDAIDTRRETSFYDYEGEKYAHIGRTRMGQDLMNVGYRAETYAAAYSKATGETMSAEQWLMEHLKNPRNNELQRGNSGQSQEMAWSNCPAQHQMFNDAGHPTYQAKALVSYLMSMKHDDAMPASMDYAPKEDLAQPANTAKKK
ncbi:MAG: hypothetical protein ACPG32_00830 [Akkermansiaceae bacterium]